MNKQDFQQKIKDMKPPKFFTAVTLGDAYEAGFEEAKYNALYNSCFLNEPKKPVIPKYVADMIVEKKEQKNGIVETIKNLGVYNNPFDCIIEKQLKWITENQEDFAKAWLYGYEIEKEKRYTAKLKLTDEYLCCESQFKDLLHYKVPDSSAKEVKAYHFTEDDLVKYHIWGNDNYEVKKVEE